MVTITIGDEDASQNKTASVNHEQKRELIEFLISVVDFEAPIRHCYFIQTEIFLRYIVINNSQNFLIYFGLYTILNKMNIFSLFYWISMYRILKKNFKPNIFQDDNVANDFEYHGSVARYNMKARYGSQKNQSILTMVYLQLFVVSLVIITQLSFGIYTNMLFQ